jgi:hypothetical protein
MKYGIDRIVVRHGRIFGFGWICHPEFLIDSIALELTLSNGTIVSLPVAYNKPRDDVHNHYPKLRHSLHSGFVVYGGWRGRGKLICADLVGEMGEGGHSRSMCHLPISQWFQDLNCLHLHHTVCCCIAPGLFFGMGKSACCCVKSGVIGLKYL